MDEIELQLRDDLIRTYGAFLGATELMHALAFRTRGSLARSIRDGHFTVPMVKVSGRSGRFAAAEDVAHWIATQRETDLTQRVAAAPASEGSD